MDAHFAAKSRMGCMTYMHTFSLARYIKSASKLKRIRFQLTYTHLCTRARFFVDAQVTLCLIHEIKSL